MSQTTVCKWRARFVRERLDGLYDEPRPGTHRRITDEQVEQVIVRTLEEMPHGATHWSVRGMAKASGLGRTTVQQIWRAFGRQPHRTETFKLSTDPLLIEKVRDIVGLYMHPPTHAVVCCVDEKSQIQALDRTQPVLPMRPGQVERRTHDYRRHGTTTLFAALNVKTSRLITHFHQRHRSTEFRHFLDAIDAAVSRHLDVHLIMDNCGTHKTALIRTWFAKRPRVHVHFTPTYGSWLNLVERWFAELTNKQLRRGVHRSVAQLKAAIREFIDAHHADPNRSFGPRPPIRFSTASRGLPNARSTFRPRRLLREPPGQDTSAWRQSSRVASAANRTVLSAHPAAWRPATCCFARGPLPHEQLALEGLQFEAAGRQ
jgi:transposase